MSRLTFRICPVILAGSLLLCPGSPLAERIPVEFFGAGAESVLGPGPFDPSVPTPEAFLGFALGERPARHAQVLDYFQRLATVSPKVKVFDMGQSYEGRRLIYAVISEASRISRLDAVERRMATFASTETTDRDYPEMAASMPAVVWLAYSIHGDEISGVDAALAVAYRLAAGTDTLTARLLSDLVVIIDPVENPDGRERFLAQMEAFATAVPVADGQSLQRGGFWPWGRGNHYLFDMNRDWFSQELPESKARVTAITRWHPQVLVDAHEMGQWDTYLFNPPRAPFNPQLTGELRAWWTVFARDQATAFDRHGWAYYTREWNEEWFPGYGSSWPLFGGAVGILYEQAGVSGSRVSQPDGTVLTYAESVAHQYVSSMANVTTAADHRVELLTGYHEHRLRAIREFGGGGPKAYLVKPDRNVDRFDHLAATLTRQGIRVFVAEDAFTLRARDYYETEPVSRALPSGTLVIPTNQPEGFLVQTILGFDPHMPDSFLAVERRELLKHRDSRIYEVTGWSLLPAYGLAAYETEDRVSVSLQPWSQPRVTGSLVHPSPRQGFIFETHTDRALEAVAMLYDRGLKMHAAKKDLDVDGQSFLRGSVFLPARANPANYEAVLDSVARKTGLRVVGVNSGLGDIGPDLGGGELVLLRRPRVALVCDEPTNFTSMGAVWHLLDQKLGVPASLISASRLSWIDLSVYNVIILPDAWGSYEDVIGKGAIGRIRQWIDDGGTLIAIDGGATFCADSSVGLSSVRVRSQVLERLEEYQAATAAEIAAEEPDITKLQVWAYAQPETIETVDKGKPSPSKDDLERADDLAQVLSPHGAVLRVDLDSEDWLTFGMDDRVPVMLWSSEVFLAQYPPVRTVGRFAAPQDLRIAGLLWPEARTRLAHTAFCTREGRGHGQVILFADDPNFRAYFRGAERLLSNAILFGPGMGTWSAPEW